MPNIFAIVTAGKDQQVAGVLAAEALRCAAASRGLPIAVEVRTDQGVLNALEAGRAGGDDRLLLVGPDSGAGDAFPHLPRYAVSLTQVLADAGGVLDELLTKATLPQTIEAKRIVAVTSCPTGIAHTFMAAEGLQQAALAMGHALRVETQGSVGARDELTPGEIAGADLVLVAADREVDLARFAGKPIFLSSTKAAINNAKALIDQALAEARTLPGGPAQDAAPASKRAGPYKHLMTGVSFMLPFVVAGGLLIALAFAIGGIYANEASQAGTFAHALFQIGADGAFKFIVPALAGYIAFSIANRPGLAPGMVGGALAANIGAGFIGGILAGFIAGYLTEAANRLIRLPKNLEGLKPVLILPVLGTLGTGLLMLYAVGTPVTQLLGFLTQWLRGLEGANAVFLGILLGAMMAFDMGGPVNKAAYTFATGLIASQVCTPMAAVMVAGMTPPLAVALATKLFPSRFTLEEREAGNAAAVLGLSFVSEGAIPFAARDPFRVIPALMAGSALAGAISMAIGAELRVPHGGVFVLPIPGAVTHLGGYLTALVAGSCLSALLVGLLKKPLAEASAS
jgi:PTS system fructose-specific IIC component